MKRLALTIACLAGIGASVGSAQDKPKTDQPAKREWKIMRDTSTNDCIVMKITAAHPGYRDQLGTYETEDKAKEDFEKFKKEDDPKKSGFEKCTNK